MGHLPVIRTFTCNAELRVDGQVAVAFPYVRQLQAPQMAALHYVLTPKPDYVTLPIRGLQQVHGLFLTTTNTICLRLNGQADSQIVLHGGGALLLWDVLLDDAPETNVEVLRFDLGEEPEPAIITGAAFGLGVFHPDALSTAPQSGFGAGGYG